MCAPAITLQPSHVAAPSHNAVRATRASFGHRAQPALYLQAKLHCSVTRVTATRLSWYRQLARAMVRAIWDAGRRVLARTRLPLSQTLEVVSDIPTRNARTCLGTSG